jgi:hypothetical protein
MASLPAHDAVLVITHPGGGKSFDYDDYWDRDDLVYTGKGQTGHQQLTSENRYVADNSRQILVFEHAGPAALKYLGTAECVDFWPDTALDLHGSPRRVYRFRLRFGEAPSSSPARNRDQPGPSRRTPAARHRRPRPFDPSRVPSRFRRRRGQYRTREEIWAEQEKATLGHHELMKQLHAAVTAAGWTEIVEFPSGLDLWARCPVTGRRCIFEAKTVRPRSESRRIRAALAQLLEYRFLWGEPQDELCVVSSAPISDEKVRFLRSLGIDAIWFSSNQPTTNGAPFGGTISELTARTP